MRLNAALLIEYLGEVATPEERSRLEAFLATRAAPSAAIGPRSRKTPAS